MLANNFDQFLLLLTTQLKNQNPLDPLDTNQFTQQLVQFASVEQQIKSNDTLASLLHGDQGVDGDERAGLRRHGDHRRRRHDEARERQGRRGTSTPRARLRHAHRARPSGCDRVQPRTETFTPAPDVSAGTARLSRAARPPAGDYTISVTAPTCRQVDTVDRHGTVEHRLGQSCRSACRSRRRSIKPPYADGGRSRASAIDKVPSRCASREVCDD